MVFCIRDFVGRGWYENCWRDFGIGGFFVIRLISGIVVILEDECCLFDVLVIFFLEIILRF